MAFLLKKPEVVYERALEFISIGKDKDALNSLYDFIKDNRRKIWNEMHEKIMLKFVELCVDSKSLMLAKDGLYHYKNFTQQTQLQSLGTVIEKFMCLAEQKALEARKSSAEKIEEIGDLEDTVDIPEKMLLAAVTVEVAQDRMDRTMPSPWMCFLWDVYRNLLELLRNNVFIETLYQEVARRVFNFCVQYQRKIEFRRLCENLRLHLQKLILGQNMIDPNTKKPPAFLIRLNNPLSLMLMLETRLVQMDTAIKLDLWMEAFKSATDVNYIICSMEGLVKDKKIKPSIYVGFYEKLALLLLKGGVTLYHAAALLQKFCVCKSYKKISPEEIQDVSNRLLMASLSIISGVDTSTPLEKLLETEDLKMDNERILNKMLRLSRTPTYAGILKEIYRLDILNHASKPVRCFFSYFETEQDPLLFCEQSQKKIEEVMKAESFRYHEYSDLILKVVATKTMKRISFIYESMPLERFSQIIPYYDRYNFERFIVELSKYAYGKFKIDHCKGLILFEPIDETLAVFVEDEFDDEDVESLGFNNMRQHLEDLYFELENMNWEIFGDELEADALNELNCHIVAYKSQMEAEEKLISERLSAIEIYKVNCEKLKESLQKEKLDRDKAEADAEEERLRVDQKKRLDLLAKEQELLRVTDEIEMRQKEQKQKHIEQMQKNPIFQHIVSDYGVKALLEMDLEALEKEEINRLETSRKDTQSKLLYQEKKFDYSVRAFHSQEINLRKAMSEERKKLAVLKYQKYQTDSIEKAKLIHQQTIITYERLQRAKDDAVYFLKEMLHLKAKEVSE